VGAVFTAFHLYLIYRAWKIKDGILFAIVVTSAFYIFMESTYMLNSSYLLCNISYIVAMILINKSSNIAQDEGI